MEKKWARVIDPSRVRTTEGSFAFIPHRFLREGFWHRCSREELRLYFLLVMVSDREGMSFYGKQKLCHLGRLDPEELEAALDGLGRKDLIAREEIFIQVLSLPEAVKTGPRAEKPSRTDHPLSLQEAMKLILGKGARR